MREAALDALATVVAGATGVKSVRRDSSLDNVAATNFPCVMILDDAREEIYRKSGGWADVALIVDLRCVFKARTDASQTANTLDSAIVAAIIANRTLSGAVADAAPDPQVSKNLSHGEAISEFVRPVRLFYEVNLSGGI